MYKDVSINVKISMKDLDIKGLKKYMKDFVDSYDVHPFVSNILAITLVCH